MKFLLWLDSVLLAVALALCGVDVWCDCNALMGSRVSEGKVKGHQIQDLFDGQPVVPDWIEIYPLDKSVLLYYYRSNVALHEYPWVELFVHDGVVLGCDRRD